jgi:hypothetical protein
MRIAAAFALLLFLPLCDLAAQAAAEGPSGAATGGAAATTAQAARTKPDLSVPRDNKDKWVVAFTAFSAAGLSPANRYLAYSIPLLLKDAVSGLLAHTLSQTEADKVRGAIVARELDAVDLSITRDRQRRDDLLFGESEAAPAAREGIDAGISLSQARKDFLKAIDLQSIEIAPEKPISYKEGTGPGKLFDPPKVPAAVFCSREGVDLAVGGTIREVLGYILLDLWAFDATRQENVLAYREGAQREELYASLVSAERELAGVLLGREWSSLAFAPDPPQSTLSIDGTRVATGKAPELFLAPGTREAKISAAGYYDEVRTLDLAPGEMTTLSVTLERKNAGTIDIRSDPPEAALYIGSVWKGKTPLTIQRPSERTRAVLSLTGFFDVPFSLGDDSPPQLSFVLEPSAYSREERQNKARDAFYTAFGWFALTLPLPFFAYAFALDNATKVTQLTYQGSYSQADTARLTGNVFYWTYVGGMAASISLAAWMIVEIVRYVAAADRTSG